MPKKNTAKPTAGEGGTVRRSSRRGSQSTSEGEGEAHDTGVQTTHVAAATYGDFLAQSGALERQSASSPTFQTPGGTSYPGWLATPAAASIRHSSMEVSSIAHVLNPELNPHRHSTEVSRPVPLDNSILSQSDPTGEVVVPSSAQAQAAIAASNDVLHLNASPRRRSLGRSADAPCAVAAAPTQSAHTDSLYAAAAATTQSAHTDPPRFVH